MTDTKKPDCFAYAEHESTHNKHTVVTVDCSALKNMECAKGLCPFYKSVDQQRMELIKTHGTANLQTICKAYEAKVLKAAKNGK